MSRLNSISSGRRNLLLDFFSTKAKLVVFGVAVLIGPVGLVGLVKLFSAKDIYWESVLAKNVQVDDLCYNGFRIINHSWFSQDNFEFTFEADLPNNKLLIMNPIGRRSRSTVRWGLSDPNRPDLVVVSYDQGITITDVHGASNGKRHTLSVSSSRRLQRGDSLEISTLWLNPLSTYAANVALKCGNRTYPNVLQRSFMAKHNVTAYAFLFSMAVLLLWIFKRELVRYIYNKDNLLRYQDMVKEQKANMEEDREHDVQEDMASPEKYFMMQDQD